jgi:photosystem II stability/assembly factor-like uncharacterized protein
MKHSFLLRALAFGLVLLSARRTVFTQTDFWQQTNGPYGGSVATLAVSGANVFAGTSGGGVFLSTNNGTSWAAVNTGLTYPYVQALAMSGANLLAGTYGAGVFLSTNNGISWTAVNNGLTNRYVEALAVSGANLFAGTDGGVFVSTNNGASWTASSSGLTSSLVLAFAISGPNLFAGTLGGGVFLSTDNGTNWTAVNSGLTFPYVRALAVNGPNLLAGTDNGGLFLSTNNGASWTAANTGLTNSFVDAFAVSGSDLFVGTGGGVFLSTDNGTSWTAVSTGLTNRYIHALAASGANLFAGTGGGGVFLSTDNGTNWTAVNSGLASTFLLSLAVSGSNLFAGALSDGLFLSVDNGTTWTAASTGLTSTTFRALAISGPNLFGGTDGDGVFLSTDNGANWTPVNNGLTNAWIQALVVSGTDLFAGTFGGGVFLSTNNGANWTAVNTGLTNTTVQALAVSGTNLFAGTSGGGVFLSTNNGTNWTAVNTGLTNTTVRALAVSGTNLFAGTSGGGVFLSTNNGTNWTAVNVGLTNTTVYALAASATDLFAGTFGGGVFLSTNSGTNWTAVASGLTNFDVRALSVAASGYVFAGTAGAGAFRSIQSMLVPDPPRNLSATSGDGRVTLKWNRNTEPDFLRYRIYGGGSPSSTTVIDSTNGINDTTKTITGLTNGTTYYFRITAVDSSMNESGYSNEVNATPSGESSQDLLIDDWYHTGQYLNDIIVADTSSVAFTGGTRVYVLHKDGIYAWNASITYQPGRTIAFRAAYEAGHYDPTIYLYPTATGGGAVPGYMCQLASNTTIRMTHIMMSGYNEQADSLLKYSNTMMIRTLSSGSNTRIYLDSCIMKTIAGQIIRTEGPAVVVKVTNSIFADMGHPTSNFGAGKFIDCRNVKIDSLIIRNNTLVNLYDRVVRHYQAPAENYIQNFIFDHNTVLYDMAYHGFLSLGTVDPTGTGTLQITNNLLIDHFALGEDTAYVRQVEFSDPGELDPVNNLPRMTWVLTNQNNAANWNIQKNYYASSDSGRAMLALGPPNDNIYAGPFYHREGPPYLTLNMNKVLAFQGKDTLNTFIPVSAKVAKAPGLMTELIRWVLNKSLDNKNKPTLNVSPIWNWTYDFHRHHLEYYADTLDCSYTASVDLSHAATDGMQIGDTRWTFNGVQAPTSPPASWTFKDGTGKNATIFVPTTINPSTGTRPLQSGDAVGVFFLRNDSMICAGYSLWQEGQSMGITAWGDDDQTALKDGFAEGELMHYKIWDALAAREYNAVVTYSSGDSLYVSDGIYFLSSLVGITTISHSIILPQGWNMNSSFVAPRDSTLDTMMVKINPHLVLMKNGAGQIYTPLFGGINTIGKWNPQHGYKIYMSAADTVTITGIELHPESTSLQLGQGWNLSAYLRNSPMSADSAMAGIVSYLVIVKDNGGHIYTPLYGGINTIGQMKPGQGYQMYLTQASTLTYPANTGPAPPSILTKRSVIAGTVGVSSPVHYASSVSNTGANAVLFVESSELKGGDEIGVWTEKKMLVGSGVVHQGRAVITIWGDNSITEDIIDGAMDGESLSLTVWFSEEKKEAPLSILSLQDALIGKQVEIVLRYETDGVWIAQGVKETKEIPTTFSLSQNYPNPFNPSTTIKYGLPKDVKVTLEVYNILGQRVAVLVNEEQQAGYHEVVFQNANLASGVYFYRIQASMFSEIRKMVLVR